MKPQLQDITDNNALPFQNCGLILSWSAISAMAGMVWRLTIQLEGMCNLVDGSREAIIKDPRKKVFLPPFF